MLAQAARSWVSSPLGVNLLLSLFRDGKENLERFTQIHCYLKEKTECLTISKVFTAPKSKQIKLVKDKSQIVQTECLRDAILLWVKDNAEFNNNIEKLIPTTADLVAVNVSTFKSPWIKANRVSGATMKIYNSFSYTQDVKYEARILELPMQDLDFKLVLIVPNEVDLLHTLFSRLVNQGLQAAISNIQPLFTVTSKLIAPSIQFQSERTFQQKTNNLGCITISEYGHNNVDEKGVDIKVLTCLYPASSFTNAAKPDLSTTNPPFYFCLVFQDTPIFIGQHNTITF